MGDNTSKLVEGYLKLKAQLETINDYQAKEIIKAEMRGIVFGYETYAGTHWETFERLLKQYEYYTRDDEDNPYRRLLV